jgi:hypothetical protein
VAFLLFGMIPLLSYLIPLFAFATRFDPFIVSVWFTGLAIFSLGAFKSFITDVYWFRSGMETLLIGSVAASVAFYGGYLLKEIQL